MGERKENLGGFIVKIEDVLQYEIDRLNYDNQALREEVRKLREQTETKKLYSALFINATDELTQIKINDENFAGAYQKAKQFADRAWDKLRLIALKELYT